MLGVVVGVAAVIVLVAIGSGVKTEITGQIEGLGSNLIFVFAQNMNQGSGSGASGGMGGMGGGMGGSSGGGFSSLFSIRRSLTNEDVSALQRMLGERAVVVPVLQSTVTMRAGNRTWIAALAAGSERGDEVFQSTLASGRHYNRSEWVNASRVVALASTVSEQLFPGRDPVGREVDVNGQRFTVVGTYESKGGSIAGDEDNQVYMPSTTAQRLLGTKKLSIIVVKAEDSREVDAIRRQVVNVLRPQFGEDLTVFTQRQTLGILSTLLGTLTAMLAGLASISLVVGGIGIMNIMLASVTERTREIGIRKAVGARTYDILSQFVIEATVLSLIGGGVGIVVGAVGAQVISRWVPAEITFWSVLLAFFFSAAVGVFFGVYPAYRASRLDPIEALRYE
jgi:putative ABC transport system permease protein